MKSEPVATETFIVPIRPVVADYLKHRLNVILRLPFVTAPGTRLFLVEVVAGVRTGRAYLYRAGFMFPAGTSLDRTWGWSTGKDDEDLSFLSLVLSPQRFPALTDLALATG